MTAPQLVYDDDCGFCTWAARRVAERSDVELVGFSELTSDLLARLPDDYEECAHFVTDDAVYSCGESVEQALLRTEAGTDLEPVVGLLSGFDEYDSLRERGYRVVADNRGLFGQFLSADPPRDSDRED